MFVKNLISVCVPALLAALLSFSLNLFSPIYAANWHIELSALFVFSFGLNLIYSLKAGIEDFTQLLIAAIVIKLLLALIAIVLYSFIDKAGFLNFSIHFILHYILFTVFEIRYLLYLIQKNPKHAKK